MERRVLRAAFTREYNILIELLNGKIRDKAEISARYALFAEKYQSLKVVDEKIFSDLIGEENVDETKAEEELIKAGEYSIKFYKIRDQVNELVKNSETLENTFMSNSRKLQVRLPKIELKKFDGDFKGWIGFWAQFSKIHEDDSLTSEDKFDYLFQSMQPNSPAYKLVEGFPPSKENYEKAIELLKSRFGKEEFLIEYYVRELLNLVLKKDKLKSAVKLYDSLEAQLRALDSLGVTKEKYAAMLFPLVESALPEITFKIWDRYRVSRNISTGNHSDCMSELLSFLKLEVESDERLKLRKNSFENETTPDSRVIKNDRNKNVPSATALVSAENTTIKEKNCVFCDRKTHNPQDCAAVIDTAVDERSKILRRKGACYKCLRTGHLSSRCKVFVKCIICKGPHFPIMCSRAKNNKNENLSKNGDQEIINTLSVSSNHSVTFLQTLVAEIVVGNRSYPVRVLLDSGSQRSYLKNSCAKELNLMSQGKISLSQELFGGRKTPFSTHNIYTIKLKGMNSKKYCVFDVVGSDRICANIPRLSNDNMYQLLKRKGIEITDYSKADDLNSTEIQALLGSDAWAQIVTSDVVSIERDLLAIRTTLGWTLIGCSHNTDIDSSNLLTTMTCWSEISSFWKLETMGILDPAERNKREEKDKEVVSFFENTTKRNEDTGRYIVRLPWINGYPCLQSNRDAAEKRLQGTSRKLKVLNKFEEYDNIIQDWLKQGIIEIVPNENFNEPAHYLPHRAVFKECSTTKIRPVFDASNTDKNGNSLNNCLEIGPNLMDLIPIVLTNFRIYKIALSADIEKAFLQIEVDPEDRNFLRFLWWKNDKIIELRHCRVVFGVCSSPFLLSACLNSLLENPPEHLSKISEKLKGTFYADNCLTGVSHDTEIDPFIKEATELMSSAGFNLRGWISSLDSESRADNILGFQWYRPSDEIGCRVISWSDCSTRRMLLSCIQKIFDPIGFTAPMLLIPKIILQKSWKLKSDWDDELPKDMQREFNKWSTGIHHLNDCRIPRRIHLNLASSLHVFCDASKNAYGACIFLRTEENEEVHLNLILAKSRVAPLKEITLPRLELMAALLGVRLYQLALKCLNKTDLATYFWSDSSVVLAWLKGRNKWSVFVENRVKEIRDYSKTGSWKHVPGVLNPADLLSRGCSPLQLLDSQWWFGPTFLKNSPETWPSNDPIPNVEEINEEKRKTVVSTNISVNETILTKLSSRFSKYTMIVRTIAWMLRFRPAFLRSEARPDISVEEFEKAERILFFLLQKDAFHEKKRKSELKSLQVFTDDNDVLRMKSRVVDSEDTHEYNFPVILPSKNMIVERMIEQLHLEHNHAGTQTLLMILREKVWILKGRKTVRSVVKRCVTCQRNEAKAFEVPFPPLPEDRIKMSKPFQITGTDLAGPVFLKGNKKAWIVIFTCAVFRAVHLELVTSLSTGAFLEALRRFIARRGRIDTIYSDNGTNFVGLDKAMSQLDWTEIESKCHLIKIKWKFNPPTASWWGGFWERLIRILKDLLRKNLGHACLEYEEFLTLLCECESLMNNRPLTYVSEDGKDLTPLQPSMFLQSLTSNNVSDLDEIQTVSLMERWKYLQRVREGLKGRFKREYLGFLRYSHSDKMGIIKKGNIVLIGHDDKKRMDWMLARVVELLPGKDGIVRLVRLKTSSGFLLRPVQRLFPIELDPKMNVNPFDQQKVAEEKALPQDSKTSQCDSTVFRSNPNYRTRMGREVRPLKKLNL